jgi:hypothetical protein
MSLLHKTNYAELNMRIVFIILAHKLPEQLVRLVRKLDTESSWFLIHVDKRTDSKTFRKMKEPLSTCQNVFFLDRHVSNWGDLGILKATLKGIYKIRTLGLQFDYVINLSGQDYPLKSNHQIRRYLEQHEGQTFMEYFALPDDHWKRENGGLNRVVYWHFYWRGQCYSIRRNSRFVALLSNLLGPVLSAKLPLERKIPGDLKPFGGSAWWCISKDCIEYLVEIMEKEYRLIKFFQHVYIPEELFYQTVLLNSPLKNLIVNDDLHYIIWPDTKSDHPFLLQKHDFDGFIHTDKLFARKFDSTLDAEVLDMIDEVTS